MARVGGDGGGEAEGGGEGGGEQVVAAGGGEGGGEGGSDGGGRAATPGTDSVSSAVIQSFSEKVRKTSRGLSLGSTLTSKKWTVGLV